MASPVAPPPQGKRVHSVCFHLFLSIFHSLKGFTAVLASSWPTPALGKLQPNKKTQRSRSHAPTSEVQVSEGRRQPNPRTDGYSGAEPIEETEIGCTITLSENRRRYYYGTTEYFQGRIMLFKFNMFAEVL